MANTKQGIYYQDNYSSVADVPKDMKKMAESMDTEIEKDRGRLSTNEINIQSLQSDNTTNKKDISNIKQKQTTQNANIEQNTSNIANINEEIATINEKDTAQDTNIETLTQRLNEKDNQIAELKAENEDLKADLSNSQIHGKASGEYVHLSDSAKMNCDIAVLGNSRQETRSGKNILELVDGTYSSNGITAVVEKGKVTLNGTATNIAFVYIKLVKNATLLANTQYTLRAFNAKTVGSDADYGAIRLGEDSSCQVTFYNENSKVTLNKTSDYSFNSIMIRTASGITYDNFVIYPQIEAGSGTDTWEQGGAMPSIDYTSEIKSVSSANVKVCNKNLLSEISSNVWYDDTNMKFTSFGSSGGVTSVIAPIPQNSTITVSKKNASNRFVICTSNEKPAPSVAMKVIYVKNESTQKSYTFNNTTEKWLWFGVYRGTDETEKQSALEEIQIEVSETQTDYILHEEQNYPVDMQEPFRAINDIRDCFVLKEDGKWYERHKIIGKTITGEDISSVLSNNRITFLYEKIIPYIKPLEGKYYYTSIPENNIKSNIASPLINKKLADLASIEKGNYITAWNNTSYAFMLRTDKEMTKEEAVAYFNENPFYIEYIAETPTDIECTEQQTQQLQALQKAKTYKNITNITTDTIAVLDVDYKRDLETYQKQQDDRITAIEQLLSTTATSAMLLDNVQSDLESEVK